MNRRRFLQLAPLMGMTLAATGSGAAFAQLVPPRPQSLQPPHSGRPMQPPPAPRAERRPRPPQSHGYVWTDGYWRWNRNRYEWVSGRWVAARPGKRWMPGRWQQQGQAWTYNEGRWN